MFGILYAFFWGTICGISNIKNGIEDYQWKKDAINEKSLGNNTANLYRDHKGVYRDLATKKPRILFYNHDGDACLSDINGNTVKNLSEEKREQEWKKRIISNNIRAAEYDIWNRRNSKKETKNGLKITGTIYKDVNTKEFYIKRIISWNPKTFFPSEEGESYCIAEFYMNIENAMLVDVTEKSSEISSDMANSNIFKVVPTREDIDNFINFFNDKQKFIGGWWDYYLRTYKKHSFPEIDDWTADHNKYLYK